MPLELLATCWTHAGDSTPEPNRQVSTVEITTRAKAVAGAGFTGIGFTITDLLIAREQIGYPALRRQLHDLGLAHIEVELLSDWWATGDRRAASDRVRADLLEAAVALGARQIKIGPDVTLDGVSPVVPLDLDTWGSALHELAVDAANAGTRVALEPLPMSNVASFTDALDLIRAADHPAAGLCVDIWHLERGPSTLADLARLPASAVFCVELNDAPTPIGTNLFLDTINNRVHLGKGTFDVAGFIRTLQGIGFKGPWGVEILSATERTRPIAETLTDAYRATVAQFAALESGAGRS